ncbi:hypothetical protein [Phenylobacterium sp. 58.2.17]|uniref:hypothetical protein n=1 Tax=Phenylobacterium sp. 58.2.17 TaxID=2969306 RepID=UPI002265546C|nr:hypothetical protein [Phenylobacterium sp. 58.2.17]MCX7585813.1 hypothetical protein [Phenylobacterium sp. 58.2.17]
MVQKAHSGDVLTGASAQAAERYESALEAFYCYAGDPLALLEEALSDSPQFVMGHALKAYLTMIGTNAEAAALGVQALARAEGCRPTTASADTWRPSPTSATAS